MCSNGRYTERGIKQVHGFMAERWRIEPEYVVRVDKDLGMLGVLLEPTTVVAKAWQQIAAIGQRTFWDPHTVLVVGAGPIGLLAALAGVHLGREVHVLDRVTTGPKPVLVEQLGAVYHAGTVAELGLHPDIVIECTGVVPLIVQATDAVAPGGIVCLGIGPSRPILARTTHHPPRPARRGRPGPGQETRRHQGRHGLRPAMTGDSRQLPAEPRQRSAAAMCWPPAPGSCMSTTTGRSRSWPNQKRSAPMCA
jgi:Glucose dehydrogenase C-terminus